MKAFLLAAGLGTRLRPLTDSTPKCLVEICGKPLLAWWIEFFEKYNIEQVLINLHHLPGKVTRFLESYDTQIKFTYFFEEKLIGSAGTLRENKDFVKNENDFFVCYADNLTNYNLQEFYDFHKNKNSSSSIALFETDTPKSKGIIQLDQDDRIISFEEKPVVPKSNLANAGIYIFKPSILELIPNNDLTDIGFHLLPQLINKSFGWKSDDYLIDIGTFDDLSKAETDWLNIINGVHHDI